MIETVNRIKEMRSRKGFSQEELAERSGLSLRTIQRIENGETEPRGDSLARLAAAFDVTVDDLVDWALVEDNRAIVAMTLSAISFLFNPILGIVVPMVIWLFKKDRIRGLNDAARKLFNFQITWVLLFYITTSLVTITVTTYPADNAVRTITYKTVYFYMAQAFNLIMILWNSYRISRGKKIAYWPSIGFIRK